MQRYPVNAENVKQAIDEAATIIAAWGGQVKRKESYSWVLDHAKKSEKTVNCLGRNKSGSPRHLSGEGLSVHLWKASGFY